MNSTNSTNISSLYQIDSALNYIDYSIRITSLMIHLIYIALVIGFKEFRVGSMFFLHHINIISLLYCLHYIFYIGNEQISIESNSAYETLCYASELIWNILKFLRLYSLVLLGAFRFISVFKLELHRKLIQNSRFLTIPIVFVWLFAIIMSLTLKYSFNVTYSTYFCYEGFSKSSWINSLNFFICIFIICYVVPSLIVIILYKKIMTKVEQLQNKFRLNQVQSSQCRSIVAAFLPKLKKNKVAIEIFSISENQLEVPPYLIKLRQIKTLKLERIAQQLMLLNILICLGSFFLLIENFQVAISTSTYFDSIELKLIYLGPIFRSIFLVIQSMIPIVSISFSPWLFTFKNFKLNVNFKVSTLFPESKNNSNIN
jgi:hypothetical protein